MVVFLRCIYAEFRNLRAEKDLSYPSSFIESHGGFMSPVSGRE